MPTINLYCTSIYKTGGLMIWQYFALETFMSISPAVNEMHFCYATTIQTPTEGLAIKSLG